jgi:L,D-transpeptidase catalytic domain
MLGFIGRVSLAVVVALAFVMFASAPSRAAILVAIEKSTQTMYVSVDGVTRHQWPVSTGRGRSGTPSGVFRPLRLERRWFSRRYYNSPMPYSVFFHKGLCDSRHHGAASARRTRFARLRAAASAQRGDAVCARARVRRGANAHLDLSLTASVVAQKFAPSSPRVHLAN